MINLEFSFNKNGEINIYKDFGTIALLRCTFKARHKGLWLYIPPQLVDLLGLTEQDNHVLAFILDDLDDKYSFISITREDFVVDRLRDLILDLRYKSTSRLEKAKKLAETSTVAPDSQNDVENKGDGSG